MGIQERPFENIISMNNSLSGDPINELFMLIIFSNGLSCIPISYD